MKEEISIQEELLQISLAVANQPKTTPFEVPQGYFLDFSQKIIQKIDNQSIEVDEPLPIVLEQLKNENPFLVPPGYFDRVSPFKVTHEPKVIKISIWRKYAKVVVAASVVALLLLAINLKQDQPIEMTNDSIALETNDLEASSMEGFLNEVEIPDAEFDKAVVLQDAETTLVDIDLQTIKEKLTEISEKDISFYLEQAG